jgi:hypothetical protein
VEERLAMDESYFQSAIEDRKREVSKIVEDNQIYKHLGDTTTDQLESTKNNKNTMILWLMMVAKWIKGVYTVTIEGDIKAQG